MVEWFNRSLLQLLCTYVDKQEDWEKYLHLVLFAYHSAPHSSTGCSPFLLMFGWQPSTSKFSSQNSFHATSYPGHLRAKLSELRNLVARQKSTYDVYSKSRTFTQGEPVWLSVSMRGKLDPKWEGGWLVKSVWLMWKSVMESAPRLFM